MSLPTKFEICTKYNRCTIFILTRTVTGCYEMVHKNPSLEDAWDKPIPYTEELVRHSLDCGNWIMTKNLDEPELVFPFYVIHREYEKNSPERLWKMYEGEAEGFVNTEFEDGFEYNTWPVAEVKRFIKEGIWIVKHVGEKAKEPAAKYTVRINDNGVIRGFGLDHNFVVNPDGRATYCGAITCGTGFCIDNGKLDLSNASIVSPPQAPQSAPTDTSTLTLKVDSSQVVEALVHVEKLAQAYENLAMAMESVMQLTKEMYSKGGKNV